jgi:hypothetical protein
MWSILMFELKLSETQNLELVHGTGPDGHRLGHAAQSRGLTRRVFFSWSGPHLPPPGSDPWPAPALAEGAAAGGSECGNVLVGALEGC